MATPLPANEYLVLALQAQMEIVPIVSEVVAIIPSLQEDPQRGLQQLASSLRGVARTLEEPLTALVEATPPPGMVGYHVALLEVLGGLTVFSGEFGSVLDLEDLAGLQEPVVGLFGLIEAVGPIMGEGQRLAILALRQSSDVPLNVYVVAAIEAQQRLAATLDIFFARFTETAALVETEEDEEALFSLFEELIDIVGRLQDAWQQLSPPEEARDLHRRQADLIEAQTEVNRRLLEAYRQRDAAAALAAQQLQIDLGAESFVIGVAWNQLIIEALSR
jgi:hypothetical protein